jgi:hypothetical protein
MSDDSDKLRSNNEKRRDKSVPDTHGDSGATIEIGFQTSDQMDTEKQNTTKSSNTTMVDQTP